MTNADDKLRAEYLAAHPSSCLVCLKALDFEHPGRPQTYCSNACRMKAYRLRHRAPQPVTVLPRPQPRMPVTVYECDQCGARALGSQRCEECGTFMRRVGFGGLCPSCDEPVALVEMGWPESND